MAPSHPQPEDFEFAPSVYLEEGDILSGEVTDITTRDAGYGSYFVVTLKAENKARLKDGFAQPGDEVAWHATGTVAESQLRSAAPQIGDRIGVMDRGWVRRPDGPDYRDVAVKSYAGKTGHIDWGNNGSPGEIRAGAPLEEVAAATEESESPF